MPDEVRLREVQLSASHIPTWDTRHHIGGIPMAQPASLRIARYEGHEGFPLLYLNESGEEMTDTWHRTLDDALAQADFEFSVAPNDWHHVGD